jgi:uncharacterized protein (DUF58 family)
VITKAGAAVLSGSVALYLAGWILGWTPLVAIAAVGLLAAASAVVWVLRRHDLEVARELTSSRVARGDAARATLRIRNRSTWPSPRMLAEDRVGAQRVPIMVPRLAGRATATIEVPLPTDRRGVHQIGPLRVEHADPFGLVRRDQALGGEATLWVRPRLHPLPLLPTRRSPSLEGPMADTVPTGSITFHALREYVRGDDLRHIHWRSTAKTGTLMVREHVDTSRPDTTVLLDLSPAAYDAEQFEEAVDVTASVLSSVALAGFPARLASTRRLEVGDGTTWVSPDAFLDELAAVQPTEGHALARSLDDLRRGRGSGTLVVVTGSVADAARGRLAGLRSSFDRVVYVVVRPGATSVLPRRPGVVEAQGADGAAIAAAWAEVAVR